jgi:hypothetical protein
VQCSNRRRRQRYGLPEQLCDESTGEANHKDGRGCHDYQVNGSRVVASAHKVEMSGVAFVSICVKAHSNGLRLRGRRIRKKFQIGHHEDPRWVIPPSPATWDR